MSLNEWHVEEVKGFTNKPGLGKGYVYFSKTRCGNSGLWLHWLEHVALPTMKQNNAFYGANDAKGQPLPTFFSTDGKALILRQAFEPRIISALKAENVYYARVGAGSTGIHQACDRAQTFNPLPPTTVISPFPGVFSQREKYKDE